MYHLCSYICQKGVELRSKVQKWGNSLAVRIPKAFAMELGVDQYSEVELSVAEGHLLVSTTGGPPYTLEGLLAGVTQDNRHSEVATGPAVGNEAW